MVVSVAVPVVRSSVEGRPVEEDEDSAAADMANQQRWGEALMVESRFDEVCTRNVVAIW